MILNNDNALLLSALQNATVLCKTVMKELHNFELACLRREHFGCLANFWFGTLAMLFTPLGDLLVTKTLKDEW